MNPRILVVQHEDECPPAWFGTRLTESSEAVTIDVRRPYAGDPLPETLQDHQGVLILGGHMDAHSDADHAWITQTKQLIREAVDQRVPTLGICLGHQLIAVALGGDVAVNPRGQQLGLTPIGWTAAAATDPLMDEARGATGVHWNNDVVTSLPGCATTLAQTPAGEPQAVRFSETVWGVQWHPEADDVVTAPWAAADEQRAGDGRAARAQAEVVAASEDLRRSWAPLADSFARMVHDMSHA